MFSPGLVISEPPFRRIACAALLGMFCLLWLSVPAEVWAAPDIQALRSVEILTVDESNEPLRFPSGISYDRDGDEIYVTSPQKNKVVVLTPDYFPYLSIGSGRGLQSISKTYIRDGLLYVCVGASMVEERPHIAVFDMAFMPVREIYFPDFEDFSPLDLVVGNSGNLYVVGVNGTGVMVLNPDGEFLHWIEPRDEVLGVAEKAPIIAIDQGLDGRLYLLSEGMGRVYVYDANERFLYKFGEKGGEPGKLSRPRGIAVDDFRRQVYLVDYQRHTMSIYSQSGDYLFEVGGLGNGRGWFYYPSDLIVDGQGRIVVADTFNHRLQVFEFISGKGFGSLGRTSPVPGVTEQQPPAAERPAAEPESIAPAPAKVLVHIRPLKDKLTLEQPGDFLILTTMTRSRQETEVLQQQLARKGYPAWVRPIERSKSGTWYQLLVGPYLDPLEAHRVAERLRDEEHLPAMLKTRAEAIELEIPEESGEGETESIPDSVRTQPTQSAPAPQGTVEELVPPDLPPPVIEEPLREDAPLNIDPPAQSPLPDNRSRTPLDDLHGASGHGSQESHKPETSLAVEQSSRPLETMKTKKKGASAASLGRSSADVAHEVGEFCRGCHARPLLKGCWQCHPQPEPPKLGGKVMK